ncbi:unnamed protein product, partial [Musa hybrid cultivar]
FPANALAILFQNHTANRLWRMFADRQFCKWDTIDPKSFAPLISIYVAALCTGVIGSAITEQLCKVGLSFLKNPRHLIISFVMKPFFFFLPSFVGLVLHMKFRFFILVMIIDL